MNSPQTFNWRGRLATDHNAPSLVDSRRRLAWLLAGFVFALGIVAARALWIEVHDGPEYRRLAAEPVLREVRLAAARGRILTRDGAVLASQRPTTALLVHYRALEQPPQRSWLLAQARARLTSAEIRMPGRLDEEVARVRVDLVDLHRRLARLCGVELSVWNSTRRQIQSRVERITESVNRRHQERFLRQQETARARQDGAPQSLLKRIRGVARAALTPRERLTQPSEIVVAEALDYHVVLANVPAQATAEIRARPSAYPGVQLQENSRRQYPAGKLAAHIIGHLGRANDADLTNSQAYQPGDLVGRMGIELAFEAELRGSPGRAIEQTDHRGQILSRRVQQPAQPGRDVRLTINCQLQATAEALLDAAIRRQRAQDKDFDSTSGGAIVVLDCRSGDILACAAAPRFDPNVLLPGNSDAAAMVLAAGDRPLFNRATRMAIPPGSVMKPITAVALLESGTVTADQVFYCQGFLNTPRQLRCMIYRHFGVGHDDTNLARALAESCNTYFFHHAPQMGSHALAHWSGRFGLGQATGIELPAEASGSLPTKGEYAEDNRQWRDSDTRALSIGQSTLTTTPLQIARAMSGIATGRLVAPRIVLATDSETSPPSLPVGARMATLAAVRRGMELAVTDPDGTAHAALSRLPVRVAAKTGTAETGGRSDHAWLAGFAPVDQPQIAFAVALEHGGSGAAAAGPVARGLLARLIELDYLDRVKPGSARATGEGAVRRAAFNQSADE